MNPKHSFGHSLRRWVRLVLLGVTSALSVHAAAEPKRTYNLPADEAVAAFRRFSDFSGREILFAAEVARGVRTNSVQGEFTAGVQDGLYQVRITLPAADPTPAGRPRTPLRGRGDMRGSSRRGVVAPPEPTPSKPHEHPDR